MGTMETSVVDTSQSSHPEVLVDTEWVGQHLSDSNVRIIEADEDVLLYETGYIPNAVKLDWHSNVLGSSDGAYPERMWTLSAPGGLEP
jgi:3-mercaptopyruvate sulfurtransferase SseA